jgi:hypothetical protein
LGDYCASNFEGSAFKPWLDEEELLPGQLWEQEIPRALQDSDFILIFFSQNSVNKHGYIQREFKLTLDAWQEIPTGRIYAIPIRLDNCEIPEQFRKYQWVDLFDGYSFERVIQSIRAGLLQRQQTESVATVPPVPQRKLLTSTEEEVIDAKPQPDEAGGTPLGEYKRQQAPVMHEEGETLGERKRKRAFGRKRLILVAVVGIPLLLILVSYFVISTIGKSLTPGATSMPEATTLAFTEAIRFDLSHIRSTVVRVIADRGNRIGSGTIIKVEGQRAYVLTAYHVIQRDVDSGISHVQVEFFTEDRLEALISLRRIDVPNDIAVLTVQNMSSSPPPAISWGSSAALRDAQRIYALGHPIGSPGWVVTDGTVSRIQGGRIYFSGTAAIPGNSGGPLLNSQGAFVGMNMQIGDSLGLALEGDVIRSIIRSWGL